MKPIKSLHFLVISISVAVGPIISQNQFTNIASITGTNDSGDSFGCAWVDYDGDGDLDLYVVTNGDPNRLYRNEGNESFNNVASIMGIALDLNSNLGNAWADYDNDGDLDAFITQNAVEVNKFFRNDNTVFTEIGAELGFDNIYSTYSATWGDFDNDGLVDLFLPIWANQSRLFKNYISHFQDVTDSVGLSNWGYARAAKWFDYDNDGDLDIYLCRGWSSNSLQDLLYRNDNGFFTEVASSMGITEVNYSQGVDCGDYDNDGDFDIYVATAANQPNKLYRNDIVTFTDVSSEMDVDDYGPCISPAWFDYDNDGDLDLIVTRNTGFPNILYENRDETFVQIQDMVGLGDDTGLSIGLSVGDFNQDGFLDFYVTNRFGENSLFRNNGNNNNWIHINTIGTISNRSGIGTKVIIISNNGDLIQTREVCGGSGESSQNSLTVEFGFGNATIVDTIKIEWPSGTESILENVTVNQMLIIVEEESNCILIGDVNIDGSVDIIDILLTVDHILGRAPSSFNLLCADCNNDGVINILDIICMLHIIFGS